MFLEHFNAENLTQSNNSKTKKKEKELYQRSSEKTVSKENRLLLYSRGVFGITMYSVAISFGKGRKTISPSNEHFNAEGWYMKRCSVIESPSSYMFVRFGP